MYLDYFQLSDTPFRLTPDTQFFYHYSAHKEALEVLCLALNMGEGFIKVTGEVGTGKTLLCHQLMHALGETYHIAHLANPFLSHRALQMAVASELGLEVTQDIPEHELIKTIQQHLIALNQAKKHVVLLIDEAQSIPEDSLESLRLLTNFETEKSKLVQVVLFGQPELDIRLDHPAIRQLKQRISFSYQLQPMDALGVEGYIQHRLSVSGYNGAPLFSNKALQLIYKASRGIPRVINILCHKALMLAYSTGEKHILPCHIRTASMDTALSASSRSQKSHYWLPFCLGLVSTALSASVLAVLSHLFL